MEFQLWKARAIAIGLKILLLTKAKSEKPLKGLCCPNGIGDIGWVDKFDSKINRVGIENESAHLMPFGYWVLVPCERTPYEIAGMIANFQAMAKNPPRFYAVGNERNDLTTAFIREIRQHLAFGNEPMPVIVKGAHTSCVEHAGQIIYYEYLTGKRELDFPNLPHLLHIYLKAEWENDWIENIKRKALFAYIVKGLQERGHQTLIVDEAHSGSTKKPGYPDHGDFVYCSKKGWEEVYNLCDKLGVTACHYYHGPFMGYEGNTVL